MATLTTDRAVKAAGKGRHSIEGGLYLEVREGRGGALRRLWLFRFQLRGRRRDLGLGPYPAVSLADARQKAAEARAMVANGVDPVDARKAAQQARKPMPTFADIAALVIADAAIKSADPGARHLWARRLGSAFCGPLLARPVNEITTVDVAAVLAPIWRTKPEVARKVHPAIRKVFDRARVILRDQHCLEMSRNPADWSDLKALGFEAPRQLTKGHNPSLPYAQMPDFIRELRSRGTVSARALEFLILTGVRTDAVRHATWEQFDIGGALWTVPLSSLKDRAHRSEAFRVPLSGRAVEIVREMGEARVGDFVFPGRQSRQPLSRATILSFLKSMNDGDAPRWLDPVRGRSVSPHGFRASLKTWCEEASTFPHAVVEMALGHQVGNAVERAYRRTDLLEQRRKLMSAWSEYVEGSESANVVRLRA